MTTTQIAVLIVGTIAVVFCIYQFINSKKQEEKAKAEAEAAKAAEREAEEKEEEN